MQINVVIGDITQLSADAALIGLFEGQKELDSASANVDKALQGLLSELVQSGEFDAQLGATALVHSPSSAYPRFAPKKAVFVGLGQTAKIDADAVREATAIGMRVAVKAGAKKILMLVPGVTGGEIEAEQSATAVGEGTLLGLYTFAKYKSKSQVKQPQITLIASDNTQKKAFEQGAKRGVVLAQASNLARDMTNEPPNIMTPMEMAKTAKQVAEQAGLNLSLLGAEECRKLGMNAYLGVSTGSNCPPQFIVLNYRGDPTSSASLWLVGKSITFDSGGLSLKPPLSMVGMKADMAGGAAVIAAIEAIAKLKIKLNVSAVCAAAENMPGGGAQRPGDIVQAMNGKWIEVENTDAEGRLTLADAVGYAVKNGATAVVDVATLTGAMRIALGNGQSGGFSNHEGLFEAFRRASAKRGEPVWRLPLDSVARKQNKSDWADVKNIGGPYAGAITAAHFIAEFIEGKPWVHIDIAATSMSKSVRGETVTGATGVPARTLIQLAADIADIGWDGILHNN